MKYVSTGSKILLQLLDKGCGGWFGEELKHVFCPERVNFTHVHRRSNDKLDM